MTWTYDFDDDADETVIYWRGDEQTRVDGQITTWQSGKPTGAAHDAIRSAIVSATDDRRTEMAVDYALGVRRE